MKKLRLAAVAGMLCSLFACQNKEKYVVGDIQEDSLAIVKQLLLSDTLHTGMASTSQGTMWTAVEKAFKECFKDATFSKNVIYLGPSNSKYVGALLSKDKSITWKTIENVFKDHEGEISKFTQAGNNAPNGCDQTNVTDSYFNIALGGNYGDKIDASLKLALEDRKSLKFSAGKWRIDELVVGDFKKYMDTSKLATIPDYKTYLENNKNYIITKVLILDGFTVEVESNRKLDAGLEAKLDSGFVATDNSSSVGLKLGFSKGSNGTIKVTGTGKSYALGMLQTIKKIND